MEWYLSQAGVSQTLLIALRKISYGNILIMNHHYHHIIPSSHILLASFVVKTTHHSFHGPLPQNTKKAGKAPPTWNPREHIPPAGIVISHSVGLD